MESTFLEHFIYLHCVGFFFAITTFLFMSCWFHATPLDRDPLSTGAQHAYSVFVTLSYHYSLSCGTISTDDCRSTTDYSCSQRSMDGVGELGKLWMLLSDVLNHLRLRRKHTERYQLGLKMSHGIVNYCKHRAIVPICINVYTGFHLGAMLSYSQRRTNLAAVLFGTVWATDRCSGDGASQLGVCA